VPLEEARADARAAPLIERFAAEAADSDKILGSDEPSNDAS